MSSLQRLSLILDPNWQEPDGSLLDWSALHAHASGIKSLKLHCTFAHRLVTLDKDASDFRHFCTKASNLQQLSVSGIAIQSGMPRYSAHERMPTQPGYLTHFLVCLRELAMESTVTDKYSGLLAHSACTEGSQARGSHNIFTLFRHRRTPIKKGQRARLETATCEEHCR